MSEAATVIELSTLLPNRILSVEVDVDERDLLSKLGADLTKLCNRSAGLSAGRKPRSRWCDIDDGPHVLPLVVVDDASSSDGTLESFKSVKSLQEKNLFLTSLVVSLMGTSIASLTFN